MPDPSFAKLVLFVNALLPLTLLVYNVLTGQAGANPNEYALHTTGVLAILFLLLSLTITPLRLITGANWLSHFRRMLGLFAFFYAGVHLLIFFIFWQGGSIVRVFQETLKRPFIYFGMTAFVLMIPLAITSTNGMIKRLGGVNWKRLHMLVYPAAILGVIHYFYATKLIGPWQKAAAGMLGVVLLYRVLVPFMPGLRYRRSKVPSTGATKVQSTPR